MLLLGQIVNLSGAASRDKGPDDMTRDLEKFAFEKNCSKWREIWVTLFLLKSRITLNLSLVSVRDKTKTGYTDIESN